MHQLLKLLVEIIKNIKTAATDAPALANFPVIMANDNPRVYVKILKELYKDNGLQAPDFSKFSHF